METTIDHEFYAFGWEHVPPYDEHCADVRDADAMRYLATNGGPKPGEHVPARIVAAAVRTAARTERRPVVAVRAFLRVWNPIAQALDEATVADRGFDGGEWSGPAHDRLAEEEFRATLARIAPRFGLTADQLRFHLDAYRWNEYDCYLDHPKK